MATNARIPTPVHIRWQRLQHQVLPLVTVIFCSVLAWRLWREAPQVTTVGQVNSEVADARSPAFGTLVSPLQAGGPQLFDVVSAGQIIARVERQSGTWSDVIAPISGQVTAIHHRIGEAINTGQTYCTISGGQGHLITSYVRIEDRTQPIPGMPVNIQTRSEPYRNFRARVERVGPQYQPIPHAQLRHREEEWGLPVIIAVPPEAQLRPGELVYVGWLRSAPPGENRSANAPPTATLAVR